MIEQRLTVRLVSYWERLRGENALPRADHFNTATISDLWPFCMKLSLQPAIMNATAYKYEFVGKKVTEIFGRDLTGQTATSVIHNLPGSAILKQIDGVVIAPTPKEDAGQFVNTRSKVVKYRSCLLPFGNDNTVSHVIVGLSWREF